MRTEPGIPRPVHDELSSRIWITCLMVSVLFFVPWEIGAQTPCQDVLSTHKATADLLQADYTMGDWRYQSQLHVGLIKSRLTRNLGHLFPAVMDEINASFRDEVTSKLKGNEWTTLALSDSIMRIVCRTSNRVFIGLPMCRNTGYIDLNVKYTMDVVISANIIKQFPAFMKPMIGRFLTPIPRTYARAERLMTHFLEDRRRASAEHGKDWDDKPDDFLQWILDVGEERETQMRALMARLLFVNFGAIHTTAQSFMFALYRVAAEPETYQDPIRNEVHDVLSRYGWTKTSMDRLRRIDSLLRETLRYHGLSAVALTRVALKDFTFSDGTLVKKGETVTVASRSIHHDSAIYPDPDTFDGFRFYNTGEESETLANTVLAHSLKQFSAPGAFLPGNSSPSCLTLIDL